MATSATGPRKSRESSAQRRFNRQNSHSGSAFQPRSEADELERAASALSYLDPNNSDVWLRAAMALRNEFDDAAWSAFDGWSKQAENYDARENRTRWRSCRRGGGITIASLYRMAMEAGWRDDGGHIVPSPDELAEWRRVREAADASHRARRDGNAAKAARMAQSGLEHGRPYLPTIRTASARASRRPPRCGRSRRARPPHVRYTPSAKGGNLAGACSVVPITKGNTLASVQLIDSVGRKHFLAGGVISGGYWSTQAMPEADGIRPSGVDRRGRGDRRQCDGGTPRRRWASRQCRITTCPPSRTQMRERYPKADIVICADIDKRTGAPDRHAVDAANAVGGRLAVPTFEGGHSPERKDMNDLARVHGVSAVCLAIDNAAKVQPVNGNARPERIEPIPLVRPMPPPEPFPVDAMGVLAPAVLAVQESVQCPKALAANSVLAAVTLAAQPHINVQMPFGSRPLRPVSFFITVGRSGERKTGADEIVTRGIRKREADLRATYDAELKKCRVRHDAWEAERRSIIERSRRQGQSGQPSEPRGRPSRHRPRARSPATANYRDVRADDGGLVQAPFGGAALGRSLLSRGRSVRWRPRHGR